MSQTTARLIAFYLPQFHPVPENDAWWGKGFTEWTNVTKARPLFACHYQPHLPADLGFYDLRVPEVREAQAQLAREHGIEGFCYWHYWFHGKRLLERPLDEVLRSGKPDFPFCLGWANESWSRRWTGEEKEILLKQEYSHEDNLNHARWLAKVFSDQRYMCVNSRPIFVLYRPPALPDAKQTIDTIKAECTRLGLPEPYVIGRDTHNPGVDMRKFGCDITESSAPNLAVLPRVFRPVNWLKDGLRNFKLGVRALDLKVFDYEKACQLMEAARPAHEHIPGFFTGWDNTPRRGRHAVILIRSTPEAFGRGLETVLKSVIHKPSEERIVFLNAWNEWAEGMCLEPDQKYGHLYLKVLKAELEKSAQNITPHPVQSRLCASAS
jgi:lipopolysaccharide biosynthesis protein